MAALLFAGIKILKGKTNFWNMLCVSAVRSIGKSIVILFAIILSFLNVAWSIVFFALSALFGWIFMIPVIQSGAELSENKQVYMIGVVIVLSFVVFLILAKEGLPMYVSNELKGDLGDLLDKLSDLGSYM